MCAGFLTLVGSVPTAQAVQATGHDAVPWANGWSWTYGNTSFNYNDGQGTNVTMNESVTYSVVGQETFNGHDAYKLNISGSITGGSGDVTSGGTHATLDSFSGSVSGTRYVRRSDLALLQENQHQHLNATAHVSIFSQGITADIDLHLTPNPSWRIHDFPLNNGDTWHTLTDIPYTGGFTYDAGSIGGSGSSPFDGTLHFDAPTTNTATTVNAMGNANLPVDRSYAANADNSQIEDSFWSPQYKNQVKEYMKIPMDGAVLQINRTLTAASLAPANSLSATATPSYTCAGGTVTVSGSLSTNQSAVAVTARLDRSQVDPGQGSSASTTTGANGVYSVTLPVPAQADGLTRGGSQPSRANWGVLVTAPAANAVGTTTVVVSNKDCSTISYTGATAGPQTGTATVSAELVDLATPANAAGRTVTFALTGGSSVNAVTDSSGVATATLPVNGPPRGTTISASFAGAADLEAASTSTAFTVTTIPTSTAVIANPSTVVIGDPVTFTATVSPGIGSGTPTGTVQFKVDGADFGAPVALSGGSATSAAISTLGLGFHDVQAVYLGSGDHAGSTSPSTQFRVRNPLLPTATTEAAAPSAAVSGQTVTLTADVSATSGTDPLTGSVRFSDGATVLGDVGLDAAGHASLDVDSLTVGSHSIVATYSGDDVYAGSSSSPGTVTVARSDVDVQLSADDDTTVTGEAVDFTAVVAPVAPGAGVPSGAAQLLVDGSPVGSAVTLDGGLAVFPALTTLGAGTHTIGVSYSGDAWFKPGSDTATQVVSPAGTSTTVLVAPSPSLEEQAVTITATVAAAAPGSGAPTGTILFKADGGVIGAAPLNGSGGGSEAVLEIDSLAPGTHVISASYGGDSDFLGSESDEVTHTVLEGAAVVATSTSVSSSDNPSTYGELIAFTATVVAADDSTPTGTVQFSLDGADFGEPVELDGDGVAVSATLASPDPGDHTVIAAYQPASATYSASGDLLTQTVQDAGTTVSLESSDADSDYGQAVTFTATVGSQQLGTGTPTGYVQFSVDGTPLGNAVELEDGTASSASIADLAPGSHVVTVLYSGDVDFLSSTSSLGQDVAKVGTTTTLVASTVSPTFGDNIQLTATVTPAHTGLGAPTGTVTFRDGATTLATVPVSASGNVATASVSRSDLGAGGHPIVAEYSGTPQFAASTSPPVTVTVGKRATTLEADALLLRVNPLLGVNVGVVRAVLTTSSGPLSGRTIVFTSGATALCSATTDATGLATCSPPLTSWLAATLAGRFTATFAGDANHQGSSDIGTLIK